MKSVYLDTCVWMDLADPANSNGKATPEQLKTLEAAVAARKIELVLAPHVCNEVARLYPMKTDLCAKTLRLMHRLAARRFVKHHAEIWKDEAQACFTGTPLPPIYYDPGSPEETGHLKAWDKMGLHPEKHPKIFENFRKKDHPAEKGIKKWVEEKQADFKANVAKNPPPAGATWTVEDMKKVPYEEFRALEHVQKKLIPEQMGYAAEDIGLDKSRVPDLVGIFEKTRALRMSSSILIAWLHAFWLDEEEVRSSPRGDTLHAVYACRTDCFVTSDFLLIAVFRKVPELERCEVLHWDDFISTH